MAEKRAARRPTRRDTRPTTRRPTAEDLLVAKAREIEHLRELVDKTSFAGDEREVADELSAVDQHIADTADVTLQREMDYTVKEVLGDEAEQIRRALRRKAEGKYGICENCGRRIPKARLEARPEATLCIDCQRLLEGSR
jgi:RNA polymerase-binding transcription factor DksA